MDFSFSEEQEAVRELAAQIFGDAYKPERLAELEREPNGTGYDDALWQSLAEANLLGVALPEAYGGSELGLHALCILLEEAGRRLAPVPLLPALVYGALPLEAFGSRDQKRRWLPGVASGEVVLTAALQEEGSSDPALPHTEARRNGSSWTLHGDKGCVPAATIAARILVPARTGEGRVGVFLVDPQAAGVVLEPGFSTNNERRYALRLDGVTLAAEDVLGDPSAGELIVRWLALRAKTALCAMQLGVASSALLQTAEYTSTRKQFNRQIGSFQAVTMRMADGFIDLESMRSCLWQAIWRLEQDLPAEAEVAAARWWACLGGHRIAHSAQHLHGGIGSDIEYPIHRYFLWAQELGQTLGGAGQQLAQLGRLMATS
jgi:alkylation response protein AidB-like acyl-CoA dehydrogenase